VALVGIANNEGVVPGKWRALAGIKILEINRHVNDKRQE
jgi:hypothetical protein